MFAREIVHDELLDAVAQALAGRGGRRWAPRVRRRRPHRRPAHAPARAAAGRRGSSSRAGAWSSACARSRTRARSPASAPPPSWPTRRCAQILERGLAGRTEREVAIELELADAPARRGGPSFPSIVASGAHGALPHAEPRDEPIARDVLVTIDWGALLEGYCSDCTRTYATGEGVCAQAREVYELVRRAQAEALAAVRAGPSGAELDARRARGDRGRRPRRALRPRPRPRRRHGGPRGPAPVAHRRRGSAAGRATSSRSSPASTCPGDCGVRIEDLRGRRARTVTRC